MTPWRQTALAGHAVKHLPLVVPIACFKRWDHFWMDLLQVGVPYSARCNAGERPFE